MAFAQAFSFIFCQSLSSNALSSVAYSAAALQGFVVLWRDELNFYAVRHQALQRDPTGSYAQLFTQFLFDDDLAFVSNFASQNHPPLGLQKSGFQ